MTIWNIENPRTETYKKLKDNILGQFFPWSWNENTITTAWESTDFVNDELVGHVDYLDSDIGQHEDFGFYSHGFLARPEGRYSEVSSNHLNHVCFVVNEILGKIKVETKDVL